MTKNDSNRYGFTLLELLIVIGIIAVLSATATVVLNPAELLKQARDSQRMSDLNAINKALDFVKFDNSSANFGNPNTIYLSILSPSSDCGYSMGNPYSLPSLQTGWVYQCPTTMQDYRKIDGSGWIPVNFTSLSINPPLAVLPIDPVNSSSNQGRFYYTYVANTDSGRSFARASLFESQKYKGSTAVIRENCAAYGEKLSCYYSLSLWEAAHQRDLVASNEIATVQIEGAWANPDATPVTISSDWTTGPNNYIKIYTTAEARHSGKWDANKYRLVASRNDTGLLRIEEDYVRIEGLQLENTGMGGGIRDVNYMGTGEFQFSHNIIRDSVSPYMGTGIDLDSAGSGSALKVWNNIVYDLAVGIYWDWGNSVSGAIHNNTVVDSSNTGIWLQGSSAINNLYLKNNIVQDVNRNYYLSGMEGSATNLSEDATSPNMSYRNSVVSFEDEISDNFLLSSSDTSAKDLGTDLSSDSPLSFSDDINGDERSGAWDIGADEY